MKTNNILEVLKRTITALILLICFGGAYVHSPELFSLTICASLIIMLCTEWPRLVSLHKPLHIILTILYLIAPCGLLIWMTFHYRFTDIYLPLFPLAVAFTADTCGYFVGKFFGYHKIYPSLSPGKSWEGFVGSLAGVFILQLVMLDRINHFAHSPFATNYSNILLLSVVLTVTALAGSFFFSYLKRKSHLKDAGSLLPGHGGLLDRADTIIFLIYATIIMICITKFLS